MESKVVPIVKPTRYLAIPEILDGNDKLIYHLKNKSESIPTTENISTTTGYMKNKITANIGTNMQYTSSSNGTSLRKSFIFPNSCL